MSSTADLLKSLISIPSTSSNLEECDRIVAYVSEYLGSEFESSLFESKNISSALFFSKKYSSNTFFKVILNAHLDVVPGEPQQFKPIEEKGKIVGRGAQDMKSGAAVMICVFKALANSVSYPIALQIVTDEETGGDNGVGYQLSQGVRGEFVISGESTQLDIVHKAKGIMRVRLSTHGKNAHSAYPWNGENAIEIMTDYLGKVKRIFKPVTENMWDSTLNIATIETTNTAYNVIPNACSCRLDIRYVKEDLQRIKDELQALHSDECDVVFEVIEPAHFSEPSSSYIEALKNCVQSITTQAPLLRGAHGASDLRHFDEKGMSGVEFGPVGGGLHSHNEWVDLKSMVDYEQILIKFLLSLEMK